MSATELTNGDPISTKAISQISFGGHNLHILFKESFDREETLQAVTNSINHKLTLSLPAYTREQFEKIASVIVTVLSPSKTSKEIQSKDLGKYTLGSFVDDKSSHEISLIISFKGAPCLSDIMIFKYFIHLISMTDHKGEGNTTSPKEVLCTVIDLIDVLTFDAFSNEEFMLDIKRLVAATGGPSFSSPSFLPSLLPSLYFQLARIYSKRRKGMLDRGGYYSSERTAGLLIDYLITKHNRIIGPYKIQLESMVSRFIKSDNHQFSMLYPIVLECIKNVNGVKGTQSLWTTFMNHLNINANNWKDGVVVESNFIDTLKSTLLSIGPQGITTSELEEIGKIVSIALVVCDKERKMNENFFNKDDNDNILRKMASIAHESMKMFGQPFITVILPDLPLLISLIYTCKWRSEFIPYLMEIAITIATDDHSTDHDIEIALSCFRNSYTKKIKFIRPHFITLVTVCGKYIAHSTDSMICSSSMTILERIMSKQWIEVVMGNLGVERINSLCQSLLKATEKEEICQESLNGIISTVANWRMRANQEWNELLLFIKEASSNDNHNMKKTAISVLRRVPSLVIGVDEAIANCIKDILLACIKKGQCEEVFKTFSVLAKESEAKDDEWLMRSLSEMIPTVLTMVYCALENGTFTITISNTEKAVYLLVEILLGSIMKPYLPSIVSLLKATVDKGRRDSAYTKLGDLAALVQLNLSATIRGLNAMKGATSAECKLGSESIVVGDLEVEKDYMAKAWRLHSSRSFKRLDPPKSSFACKYSLFASIDNMKPTEGACLLLYVHSHGYMDRGDIMIRLDEGEHNCEGYKGNFCDTTENDGEAWPIYLTDVIYHMYQRLKQFDKEEKRGVKSVAIISPLICLKRIEGPRSNRHYNFNEFSTDNVSLILNCQDGGVLAVKMSGIDPSREVPLEILANHQTIREGLDALRNVENGKHGKFRVYMDPRWMRWSNKATDEGKEVSIFGAFQADKSAFVPSDLPSEDVNVEIGDVISSEVLNCMAADKSAFIVSSSHEEISDDVCVDDLIFGKIYAGSDATPLTQRIS